MHSLSILRRTIAIGCIPCFLSPASWTTLGTCEGASAVSFVTGEPQPAVGTVNIWLNVFIPGKIEGYARALPTTAGANAGKSVIPAPSADVLSGCFLTDQRDFDSSSDGRVHSRISHGVVVDFGARKVTNEAGSPAVHATNEVDCNSGALKCEKTADSKEIALSAVTFETLANGRTVAKFTLSGAATNPCFPKLATLGGPPAIDWSLPIRVEARPDSADVLVSVEGDIDGFPAFELYARPQYAATVAVFKEGVPKNNTVVDLFPGHMRHVVASKFTSLLPIGSVTTTDSRKRFTVSFGPTGATMTEINEAGASLTHAVKVSVAGGLVSVERENDDQVLRHLGFSDAGLRASIVGAKPKPSRLILDFRVTPIAIDWYGLAVRKKPNNTFDSLIQPGDKPPSHFEATANP